MRKFIVGGNWKCNGNMQFAKDFPTQVLNTMKFNPDKVEVVVAPTNLHLTTVQQALNSNV